LEGGGLSLVTRVQNESGIRIGDLVKEIQEHIPTAVEI